MAAITTSANAIVEINKALQTVLQKYLDPEETKTIDIRFDLPEVNSTQTIPTVSVFLYDVHEDLQLRQSEVSRLNKPSSRLYAGWVNLNCNYLLTYWEAQTTGSGGDGPDSSPDNQAAQVMTRILHALLNNRELDGIAGAYTRIIPPQENLNSLGNFWQALGNRPRLSLMYSVTVPLLLDNSLPQTLVKTVSSDIIQSAVVDREALSRQLWQMLCEKMGAGAQQTLAGVTLECLLRATDQNHAFAATINLKVSGFVDNRVQSSLEGILHQWAKSQDAVTRIDGAEIYIDDIDMSQLQYLGD
ncbi:DUF4255 domain-containing protein [Xenorhabdus bovienii]|uniref:DUF4255 domain-containing protein n=1 Tax=Xenorhabdus bovienii TaxID=40576 RepID=UPI0023B28554|nr:DUF4255 domain-containing protein [Xenorhabdus bovienii]MDE9518057.1 DUF4255 domain-containing protein [Xenorhabdus bovienii]